MEVDVAVPAARRGRPRPLGPVVGAAAALVAVTALVGCTAPEPPPPDDDPPTAEDETGPTRYRVGVVLNVDGGTDTADVDDLTGRLADLEDRRSSDVAEVRAVVPDAPVYALDVAAVLADDGYDLVCVLGRVVRADVADLADRYPGTRFCTVGEDDLLPDNVTAVDLAQEELGHVLGVAAAELAAGGPVAWLIADESDARLRRAEGGAAGLAGTPAALTVVPTETVDEGATLDLDDDADVAIDLVELRDALDDLADEQDDAVAVHVVDGPASLFDDPLAELPSVPVVAPGPVGRTDSVAVDVRYTIAVDAIVERALAVLTDPDAEHDVTLGFADDAFVLTTGDEALGDRLDAVIEELVAGDRDPLASPNGQEPADLAVLTDPLPAIGSATP